MTGAPGNPLSLDIFAVVVVTGVDEPTLRWHGPCRVLGLSDARGELGTLTDRAFGVEFGSVGGAADQVGAQSVTA